MPVCGAVSVALYLPPTGVGAYAGDSADAGMAGSAVSVGHQADADPEGVNVSGIHTDFMIGGPEVDVDGVTRDGRVVPLLRDNRWQLPE